MNENPFAENPYQSPSAAGASATEPTVDWRQVFLRWELLRLAYNAAVGGLGLALLMVLLRLGLPLGLAIVGAIAWGVAANLCYTLGPCGQLALGWCAEHWPTALPSWVREHWSSRQVTWALFVPGLIGSLLLTLVVAVGVAVPYL